MTLNIIIININIKWVYRLYEEYVLSIKNFINLHFKNINIYNIYYDIDNFDVSELDKFNLYDIIFYSGDLGILNNIIEKISFNYKKIYFINIEQLSHPSYYKMIRSLNTDINIIDYSEENIPFLKNIFRNVYLAPPFFNKYPVREKIIDIITILNNDYRRDIFTGVIFNEKYIYKIIDNCYDKLRDEYFAMSKFYINIHCSVEHQTMELIRLINLISKRVIIISQPSIYIELLFIKDYIIICNDFNDIQHILEAYEYYYNKIYANFDEAKYIDYVMSNISEIFSESGQM